MRSPAQNSDHQLPGNHGQFGENNATEKYKPLRATQPVNVKPVVPRQQTQKMPQPLSSTMKPGTRLS